MKKYGLRTATALVIANMIGVGVFTSLGFQLEGIADYRSILLLWIIGGAIALMGSYCYSELSAAFPGSGGEYHFLQLSFGKFVGFLSGSVSATVGFAAPIAAAAFTFSAYLRDVISIPLPSSVIGSILVLCITGVHILKKDIGAGFQVSFTFGKVLLLLTLIASGLLIRFTGSDALGPAYLPVGAPVSDLLSGNFWVSLIFVSYAYSGWNASAYIIDEVEDARRNVPRSILTGTTIVLILYTAIHFVFLLAAPAENMKGKQDVAFVAATHLFGEMGATVIASLIAFFLISTISSMILVGPRIIQRLSSDHAAFHFFSVTNRHQIPVRAIFLQSGIAVLILMTSQFQWIITSIGFILLLFNTLTVFSLFLLRYRFPKVARSIRVPFYPYLPALFIFFNGWIMVYLAMFRSKEVLHSMMILGACAVLYVLVQFRQKAGTAAVIMPVIVGSLLFFSCSSDPTVPEESKDSKQSMIRKQPVKLTLFKKNTSFEKKAAVLTGLDTAGLSVKEQRYAANIRNEWLSTRQRVLQPVEKWAYNEIPASISREAFVFYPFSGPDFAFANALYPGAARYVLVGLEPVGLESDAADTTHAATRNHLGELNRILYYSNRFGFFRTKDMSRQLKKIGVFNILLFYIKNSGYEMGDLRLLRWDAALGDTTSAMDARPNVCFIEFRHPLSGNVSQLFYFSRDLSDRSLRKDTAWLTWIEKQVNGRPLVSLTKSASYLMHSRSFSLLRNFMLEHSRLHIQDDTGIPYRYLANADRVNTFYGEYKRPIALFSRMYQPDLRGVYDSAVVRPLPFRIGYTAVSGKCNLQLSLMK